MTSSKNYYQMAMDDVSDAEVRKAMELKLSEEHMQKQLSESMHVNYDHNATSLTLPEYGKNKRHQISHLLIMSRQLATQSMKIVQMFM